MPMLGSIVVHLNSLGLCMIVTPLPPDYHGREADPCEPSMPRAWGKFLCMIMKPPPPDYHGREGDPCEPSMRPAWGNLPCMITNPPPPDYHGREGTPCKPSMRRAWGNLLCMIISPPPPTMMEYRVTRKDRPYQVWPRGGAVGPHGRGAAGRGEGRARWKCLCDHTP